MKAMPVRIVLKRSPERAVMKRTTVPVAASQRGTLDLGRSLVLKARREAVAQLGIRAPKRERVEPT